MMYFFTQADSLTNSYWTFLLTAIWVLPWKGYALWLAARNKQKWWFVALLVINTLAILEIIYIFFFSKPGLKKEENT